MTLKDILRPIIEHTLEEAGSTMPDVPSDLSRTLSNHGAWSGAIAGAASGAYAGAGFGIAGGPLGAIAGTVPGAIIGGIVGYFSGEKIGSKFENEDDDLGKPEVAATATPLSTGQGATSFGGNRWYSADGRIRGNTMDRSGKSRQNRTKRN